MNSQITSGRPAWTAARYDSIPDAFLDGKVLEVGGLYARILHSRHEERVRELNSSNRWLSLDISPFDEPFPLRHKTSDIFDFSPDVRFDTILALAFIEHISIRDWGRLFHKFNELLSDDGRIFLTTPYNEPNLNIHNYYRDHDKDCHNIHCTFNITSRLIRSFLPTAHIEILRLRYPFRVASESLARAIGREIYRALTWHPYRFRPLRPCKWLTVQYSKGAEK